MEAFKNGQGNHQLNENEKPQLNSRSENLGDDTNSNRQGSMPSTGSDASQNSEQSDNKHKEWKQDENWGLGKWANENLVKPAAQRVGTGIKNVAGKASDKFRESGAYTRVIKPGMKKLEIWLKQ